ncbi:MAG: GNAT family N-acetyltransferase [Byssovorax sp.]
MTLLVRVATPDDHPAVARLFLELGVPDPPPTLDDFTRVMLPRILVLDGGGEVLGYGYWQVYGRTAHVTHLVIDPGFRGRRAGLLLMRAVRERAVAEGCERWYLHVKRDNTPAIRLYERCGLRTELETWSVRLGWTQIASLPLSRAAVALPVFTPTPDDDAAIAACFGIDVERLARLRSWGRRIFVALREGEAIVAFSAFDPTASSAHSFRITRRELVRPLLEALRAHAREGGPETLHFPIEGDRALVDALVAAGAEIVFELLRMEAELSAL